MGKKCARRVFAVFMVLFLTVGILTFPSDAQEAAYTQLVQRREASLKHVLRLPIDQAIDALVRAGFHGYAYVLGESAWAEPGSFSATDCDTCSLYSVVNAVVQDLDALGFASRFDTSPLPTLELEEQLLCVRTGSQGCHFMKAASLDQWYHKPGTSVPLRWKHPTPDYKIWTNEGLCGRGYSSATAVYNSTIYYIIYWAKGGPGPDINSLDPITE